MKNIVKSLVTTAIGLLILLFLSHNNQLSWDKIGPAFLQPQVLIVNLLFQVFFSIVTILRWWIVLGELKQPVSLKETARITLVSGFFGQLLAGSIGKDGLRVGWLISQFKFSHSGSILSVVMDRIFGLCGLVIFLLSATFLLRHEIPGWSRIELLGVTGGLLLLGVLIHHFVKMQRGLDNAVLNWIFSWKGLACLGLSLMSTMVGVASYYYEARVLGFRPHILELAVAVPLSSLVGFLLATPFGIGIQQGFFHILVAGGFTPQSGLAPIATALQVYCFIFNILAAGYFVVRYGFQRIRLGAAPSES